MSDVTRQQPRCRDAVTRSPRSAPNRILALSLSFVACAIAGCVSVEQRTARDREECQARGYAPSTSAYDNCLAAAATRHDEADARQSERMKQVHEQEVDNFLTSTSIIP